MVHVLHHAKVLKTINSMGKKLHQIGWKKMKIDALSLGSFVG
jgi:hypothetical protein